MKFLKRFNREQITLGVAGLLGVLLFGWQLTRGGSASAAAELPTVERVYGIGRQSPIEFVHAKGDVYTPGRDIWDPPAAGRLPIPEIRPPEPKLGQMMLPPLGPRPDDAAFNLVALPGKFRSIGSAVATAAPAGFPPEEEIAALKALAEVDSVRVVDKRKQLMRPPSGLAVIHQIPPKLPITGRIVLDSHETADGSILIEEVVEGGTVKKTFKPEEINKSGPGEEGVERGGEYGKEYKRRAAKIKADSPDAHKKLGEWAREKAGMLPEARLELLAAVDGWRKRGESGAPMQNAVLYLVEVLGELGNYDEAIVSLQDYIETVKGTVNDTASLHLRLGKLYADLGYHERSLISYDAAFNLEPGRTPPQVALARARLNLGETKLALEQIGALMVSSAAPEPDVLVVQGLAQLRQGQAEAAEESFRRALQARGADAEALNGLGVALALQRKPDAPGKFLAAIKANQYLIDAWVNLGILYLAEGRPVEAEILFSGAAQRDPDSSTAAAGPGFIAVLKGAHSEALPAFDRARKIQPDDYFMSYAMGRLKLRENQARDALELFRTALKSNPEYLPATTDAALAYLMLARDEQRQAGMAPPDRQAPFKERAEEFRGHAQTLLEASYRSDPNSQAANAALGCVYAVRGRVREANAAFDRAVRPGVPDPLIDYGRGYVEYWYGAGSPKDRLDLAEVKFRFGASHQDLKDPSDVEWVKECVKALQSIEDWRTQRIQIEERFDGSQPSLSNQWIPINKPVDPQVRYGNNQANIGDASGSSLSGSYAALEHRDILRDSFLSVEGTLVYEASQGFEAGFSLYTGAVGAANTAAGLHFVFLEDLQSPSPKPIRVYYGPMTAVLTTGPNRPTNVLGTLPAAPTRVRFKLERADAAEPSTWNFNFSVWDDSKGAWRLLTEGRNQIKIQKSPTMAPMWFMHFWGRTVSQGRKWSVGVDDVRVLTVEK